MSAPPIWLRPCPISPAPPASDDSAAQDEPPLQKLIHSLPQTILGGTVAVLGSSHGLKALTTIPMFTGCLTITFLSSVLSIMFHRRYVCAARCSDHVAISFLVMAFFSVVSPVLAPRPYGWLVYVLCTVLMVLVVLEELQLLAGLVKKIKGVSGGAEQPVPRRRWLEVLTGLVKKVWRVSGGAEQPVAGATAAAGNGKSPCPLRCRLHV